EKDGVSGWLIENVGGNYMLRIYEAERPFYGYGAVSRHIQFTYPTSISESTYSILVPSDPTTSTPEHTEIHFENYNQEMQLWLDTPASVHVYPASTFGDSLPDYARVRDELDSI